MSDHERPQLTVDPHLYAVPYELLPASIKAARANAGLGGEEDIEFKSVATEVKASTQRTVEIWVAAYGNVDDGGDVIPFGAAKKSIEDDGPDGTGLIKFFWNHSTLLGPVIQIEEHKEGILLVGQVDPSPELDRFLAHAESGAAKHGSIGYKTIRSSKKMVGGRTARCLDQIGLYEGSLVIWPMNKNATLESVKAARGVAPGGDAPAAAAPETKDLWDFAEVVHMLAQIQSATRNLCWLMQCEWATLTGAESEAVSDLLDTLTDPERDGDGLLASLLSALGDFEKSAAYPSLKGRLAAADQSFQQLRHYTATLRKTLHQLEAP